jgi:small-conductance mechanosensitive channel
MSKAHLLLTQPKSPKTIAVVDALDNPLPLEAKLTVSTEEMERKYYFGWMIILILGALIILNLLLTNMGTFLMVATILSFLTAPFFAVANWVLVTKYLPAGQQPSRMMHLLSAIGLVYLLIFCGWYIYIKFI